MVGISGDIVGFGGYTVGSCIQLHRTVLAPHPQHLNAPSTERTLAQSRATLAPISPNLAESRAKPRKTLADSRRLSLSLAETSPMLVRALAELSPDLAGSRRTSPNLAPSRLTVN